MSLNYEAFKAFFINLWFLFKNSRCLLLQLYSHIQGVFFCDIVPVHICAYMLTYSLVCAPAYSFMQLLLSTWEALMLELSDFSSEICITSVLSTIKSQVNLRIHPKRLQSSRKLSMHSMPTDGVAFHNDSSWKDEGGDEISKGRFSSYGGIYRLIASSVPDIGARKVLRYANRFLNLKRTEWQHGQHFWQPWQRISVIVHRHMEKAGAKGSVKNINFAILGYYFQVDANDVKDFWREIHFFAKSCCPWFFVTKYQVGVVDEVIYKSPISRCHVLSWSR